MMYVNDDYIMDPDTEDLLSSGTKLKNEMLVLLADPRDRPSKQTSRFVNMMLRRWCIIDDLKIIDGRVAFVGIYEDGTKFLRREGINVPWLVKLASVTEEMLGDIQRNPEQKFIETIPNVGKEEAGVDLLLRFAATQNDEFFRPVG